MIEIANYLLSRGFDYKFKMNPAHLGEYFEIKIGSDLINVQFSKDDTLEYFMKKANNVYLKLLVQKRNSYNGLVKHLDFEIKQLTPIFT